MRNVRVLVASLCVISLLSAKDANAYELSAGKSAYWQFEVLLDEKVIGLHEFTLQKRDDDMLLSSSASFDVRLLFVNVFKYRHKSSETWRDGCLSSLSANTKANKKSTELSGAQNTAKFEIRRQDFNGASTTRIESACIKSFAYWNKEILTQDKLLNNQTGDYQKVVVKNVGVTEIPYSGVQLPAEEYLLETPEGDIRLWYALGSERWLALEAPAKGGRTIRYQPLQLPESGVSKLQAIAHRNDI